MTSILVDTAALIALGNARDQFHMFAELIADSSEKSIFSPQPVLARASGPGRAAVNLSFFETSHCQVQGEDDMGGSGLHSAIKHTLNRVIKSINARAV